MTRLYVDADILIWYSRRNQQALEFFRDIVRDDENELFVGAMQRAEILFHVRRDEEEFVGRFLSLFQTAPVTEDIVELGARIYRRWHPSHGTDENDAILAATAILARGTIVTQNVKHFPMPELTVRQGWDDSL